MRCLPAVILAVVLVAWAEGKVVPASDSVDSQQTGAQPSQLSDYIKEAQNAINTFSTRLQQNLPNQEEFVNTMKEQSTNFVNNVQAYMKNMSEEVSANI